MKNRLGGLQYGIIILTILTALIHLVLAFRFLPDFLGYMFILNGIGYLVLLVCLYFISGLAKWRGIIRWLLLAFTAVTFVLYFVFNWPDIWGLMGLIDKTIELVLMILLVIDMRN